jgi:hypothetical protein
MVSLPLTYAQRSSSARRFGSSLARQAEVKPAPGAYFCISVRLFLKMCGNEDISEPFTLLKVASSKCEYILWQKICVADEINRKAGRICNLRILSQLA